MLLYWNNNFLWTDILFSYDILMKLFVIQLLVKSHLTFVITKNRMTEVQY